MKAQKRENEIKSKYEEARKKNSLMRVLNSAQANSTNVNTIHLSSHLSSEPSSPPRSATSSPTFTTPSLDVGETGELNSRYNPDMDTLPLDTSLSPTITPMQVMTTPVTLDTLNTLKAMQTISALSHMNHLNHLNTLNILSALNGEHLPPSHFPTPPLTPFNPTLNYSSLSSSLPSPQQLFFPVSPYGMMTPLSNNNTPFNSYLQSFPPTHDELHSVASGGGQM
jgi:hypothetical protein